MQLTSQVKQSALLAELAYLKLENYEGYKKEKGDRLLFINLGRLK